MTVSFIDNLFNEAEAETVVTRLLIEEIKFITEVMTKEIRLSEIWIFLKFTHQL